MPSWLDEAFPELPNLFLPEASGRVDTNSSKYRQAVENFRGELAAASHCCLDKHSLLCTAEHDKACQAAVNEIGVLYAPRITKKLDPEVSLLLLWHALLS